jgi:hypothetical protein
MSHSGGVEGGAAPSVATRAVVSPLVVVRHSSLVDAVGGRLGCAVQLLRQRAQVRLVRAVLEVACDLGLLGFCTAAPHRVDPLALVAGVNRASHQVSWLNRTRRVGVTARRIA